MNDFELAVNTIRHMTAGELNQIVTEIKLRRTYLARQSANTFAVGDRVSFAARGMQVLGTVTKVNGPALDLHNQSAVMTNADGALHLILGEHGFDPRCQFGLVFLRNICHVVCSCVAYQFNIVAPPGVVKRGNDIFLF